MIRLVRGDEPAALRDKRPAKLAEARARQAARQAGTLTGYGDDGVKDQLFRDQHRKCAYCEKREEQPKWRDAEHYRPKRVYWWLTWTWENLPFACVDCNREYKRDQFPLVDVATALVPEATPPGDEVPLVIDPYAADGEPCAEIVFRRDRVQRREHWKPYGVTRRGIETVRVLGLDRPGLIDLYNAHVRNVVRPAIDRFAASVASDVARSVIDAWSRLGRCLDAPGQEFRGLSRDAVGELAPREIVSRYRLALWSPGLRPRPDSGV